MKNIPGSVFFVRKLLKHGTIPGFIYFHTADKNVNYHKISSFIKIPYGDSIILLKHEKHVANEYRLKALWNNKVVYLDAKKNQFNKWLVTPKTWERLNHHIRCENFKNDNSLYLIWMQCNLFHRIPNKIQTKINNLTEYKRSLFFNKSTYEKNFHALKRMISNE